MKRMRKIIKKIFSMRKRAIVRSGSACCGTNKHLLREGTIDFNKNRRHREEHCEKNKAYWRCPKCRESHYSDTGGQTTLMHFTPVWKDGVNINPDGNITSFTRVCFNCGATFSVESTRGKDKIKEIRNETKGKK